MSVRVLVFLQCVLFAAAVRAEPPQTPSEASAETCSASWIERVEDFQGGVAAERQYRREYNAAMPWFNEHCRWLSDLEIAIRKIDDQVYFVCDTQKGRPKGLTIDFAWDHTDAPHGLMFVEHQASDVWCEPFDLAACRPTLNVSNEPARGEAKDVHGRKVLRALCWHVASKECDRARIALSAYDAAHPQGDPVPPPAAPAKKPLNSYANLPAVGDPPRDLFGR